MPFTATILQVLIASPGDVLDARDAVERAIHAWNGSVGRAAGVIFLPRRWETDAIPELGRDAQSVINTQLVDEADVVIGIFHSRLGRRTERAVSGTAEELERSRQAGKPVHVYFGEMPFPYSSDVAQLALVQEFRAELDKVGLLGKYTSLFDLESRVRAALDRDAARLRDRPTATAEQGTLLRTGHPGNPDADTGIAGDDRSYRGSAGQSHSPTDPDESGATGATTADAPKDNDEKVKDALIARWIRHSPSSRSQIDNAIERLRELGYDLLLAKPRSPGAARTYLRLVSSAGKTVGYLNSKSFMYYDPDDTEPERGRPARYGWHEREEVERVLARLAAQSQDH